MKRGEKEHTDKLLCPKCETWYSGSGKAGEPCRSQLLRDDREPCAGVLLSLDLATEAMTANTLTGLTPCQLAAERAELITGLETIADGNYDNAHDPKAAAKIARHLLNKLKKGDSFA